MHRRNTDFEDWLLDDEHELPKEGWHMHCIQPTKGHVYVQEINDGQQKAHVKFFIADITANGTLKVKWSPLESNQELSQFRRGGAGTMGNCGGFHREL